MKELKKAAQEILKNNGMVTLIFDTDETKVVNNKQSLKRMFELAELFDGIKEVK